MFGLFKSFKRGSLEVQFDKGFSLELTGLTSSHKLGFLSIDTSVEGPNYFIHKKIDDSIGKFRIVQVQDDYGAGEPAKIFETISLKGNPYQFWFTPNYKQVMITNSVDYSRITGHYEISEDRKDYLKSSSLSFLLSMTR